MRVDIVARSGDIKEVGRIGKDFSLLLDSRNWDCYWSRREEGKEAEAGFVSPASIASGVFAPGLTLFEHEIS